MVIRIAICDDNETQLNLIYEKLIGVSADVAAGTVTIKKFVDSLDLLNTIEDGERYDLFFLDIEMPHISGMETAERIKSFIPDCLIVFITSFAQYAVDGYDLSIFRYILKSQINEKLPAAFNDAMKIIQENDGKQLFVKNQNGFELVKLDDILYIKKNIKNSIIVCKDGSEIKWRIGLTELFEKLDVNRFVFADRNLIVNVDNIKSMSDYNITCINNAVLQASHAQYKKIKKMFIERFE